MEMFAHVLQRNLRVAVPNLAAAIQAGDDEAKRSTIPQSDVSPSAVRVVVQDAATEPVFGSGDMAYDFPDGDEIDELLRSLSVEGWKAQNQAVRSIEPLLINAKRDQLVQIGRGLAAAANDGAVEPLDLLRRVFDENSHSPAIRSGILIGVLAEMFVAEGGEPKKPFAHPELVQLIYDNEVKQDLHASYSAVLARLAAQRRAYLGLPMDHATPVALEITLEGRRIRALKAFGNHLLEEDARATRALRRTGQETSLTVGDLMAEISREFAVPAAMLAPDVPGGMQVQLPENIGYVPWGPNTGVLLR